MKSIKLLILEKSLYFEKYFKKNAKKKIQNDFEKNKIVFRLIFYVSIIFLKV